MEPREEIFYLKSFVKQHPENRMAWYLLGKEYTLQGKEKKANYCFIQAGDVYEAFERKQHPIILEQRAAIESWARRRKRSILLRRVPLLALMLLALTVAAPHDPQLPQLPEGQAPAAGPPAVAMQQPSSPPVTATLPGLTITFVNGAESGRIGELITQLIYGSGQKRETALAVQLDKAGDYRAWTSQSKLLLTAHRSKFGGTIDVKLHDAASCQCEPVDAKASSQVLAEWAQLQEQRWVLASAIHHYRELHNNWPGTLEQLVRPYPANYLAGDSTEMQQLFEPLVQEMKKREKAAEESGSESTAITAGNASVRSSELTVAAKEYTIINLPQQPLEIVVDTANHRLALMSGDVIVRSYKVGLGGEKTPEGVFEISEKVKNPNGRDDGEFGSRGMTLSGTRYAIHGTNEPGSIGKDESLGCVRMNKEDVEELYDMVTLGTKVSIKNGVLPDPVPDVKQNFRLTPKQDETNPKVVYRWLGG